MTTPSNDPGKSANGVTTHGTNVIKGVGIDFSKVDYTVYWVGRHGLHALQQFVFLGFAECVL